MYLRMLNKENRPTAEEMAAYCKENENAFKNLNSFLLNMGTSAEIRFPYGNKYGWSVTHRKNNKLVCDIFPQENAFTVMLRMTDKQFLQIKHSLLEYTQNIINNKYPCGQGGWIHYLVLKQEHLQDIKGLLELKIAEM